MVIMALNGAMGTCKKNSFNFCSSKALHRLMVQSFRHDASTRKMTPNLPVEPVFMSDLSMALTLTLVSACSVLSGALRHAWLMSLRGRGMYCRVKLLREEKAEEERRPEEGSSY